MAGYIGSTPVPQGIQEQQSFTATAGQTTFNTLGYTDGNTIRVTLNGVLLEGGGVDYTATNGSDIVLTAAAIANDILTFETFNEFQLVSQTMTTPTISGGTLKSNVTLKNDTEQDTDGGRASKIIYQGEQSGGEISTLAEIQASHDGTADDEKGDLIFRTNDGSDGTSPTERARIDSDGSLRIANTTGTLFNSASATGIVAATSLQVATDSSTVAYLNRQTNDGQVLGVYRGGASVGNIGVLNTNNLVVASTSADHAGVQFGTHSITPMEANADADNTIDLGSAAARFNDLYLGGGAYIGGTVAANKLDDYEEGTFTAGLAGYYGMPNTAVTSTGQYTKIGNQVSFWINFENKDTTGASGNMWVTGLPFASSGNYEICWAQINTGGTFGSTSPFGLVSGTIVYFYYHVNNSGTAAVFHNAGTGRYIRTSGTYRVA